MVSGSRDLLTMQTITKQVLISFAIAGFGLYGTPSFGVQSATPEVALSLNRVVLAQASQEPFDIEDFNFWVDQCFTLSQGTDHAKTLESCQQAILLAPDDDTSALWFARSKALFDLGLFGEAITSFNQVLQVFPRDSVSLAYQCAAYNELGRSQEAVDTCEQALRLDGNWGDQSPGFAWYQRGLALVQQGRLETALDSFQRAKDNQPENLSYRASLCALAIELKAPGCNALSEAVSTYEQALALEPGNSRLWLGQGLALEQLGQYERALSSYEQAVAINPQHSLALGRQCAVLNHLQDYEAALAACEAAIAGDQQWGQVGPALGWVQQGTALIGLQDYEAALAAAERATAFKLPEGESIYPHSYNVRAVSLWHLDRNSEALAAIEEAIQGYEAIQPLLEENFQRLYPEPSIFYYRGLINTYFNQGRILATAQNYPAARDAYSQALQTYEDQCQLSLSDAASAAQCFAAPQGARILDSASLAKILVNQAVAYLKTNQLDLAATFSFASTSHDSQSLAAWYNQGLILQEIGEYELAFNAYQRANELSPNNVYVMTGQGITLAQLGCEEVALAVLDQVLNLYPGYPLAEQERQELLNSASPETLVRRAGANDNTTERCPVL
jgi:tetratricopeptide (TPR) repeat protein